MTILRSALLGAAAGAVATVAKTKAEEYLQPLGEKTFPPAPGERTGIGADAAGHPENMPPSELADRAQHAVTGDQLSDEQRAKAAPPLHWAMGVGFATAYAVAADRVPQVQGGRGALAAATLFGAAHLVGLPAAGLQHPPTRLPRAWWVWEAGSHLVYGTVLDATLRVLRRTTG